MPEVTRRAFLAGASALALSGAVRGETAAAYAGPNIVLVRFGGGVRRQEILDPATTHAPYFMHRLVPRGVLFKRMIIEQLEGVETSHGQGTLYLLTGKYDRYQDVSGRIIGTRFEAKVPTLFEYLRQAYDVAAHEALIINGEDRTDEEFYTFSNHHLFGVNYRSSVLSLYRYKTYLLRRSLAQDALTEAERTAKAKLLEKMEKVDYRAEKETGQPAAIEAFWERWRGYYGESGLTCPRGDRLLTELAVRAMRELRPRFMMINYNDPDYVHWGNPAYYFNGIRVIDEELERLVTTVEADAFYRDNTLFFVVPDCGRDNNRVAEVPFQHHFNSKSAHEIFALCLGPGVPGGVVIERQVQQADVAPTLARFMGVQAKHAEGSVLPEVFA